MAKNKNTSQEIRVIKSAHPYAMLDNDLPTMMSLVYQILAKEGISPKQPLFITYSDDAGKPKGKRARRKKQK